MKTASAKIMAFYIAILAALVTGAAGAMFFNLVPDSYLAILAGSIIVVFGSVYMLVYLLINKFFLQKINPIYNTITNLKETEKKIETKPAEQNIENLNREVEDWATNKTREIDQLKEMENYRKEFLGNVSHEMKTPLTSAQGYMSTLLDGGLDDPSINKLYLERAMKSVRRLINIVDDLDTITRLDSGEIPIHFEDFDIVSLIRDVHEVQELRAKELGIELKFAKENQEPVIVHADRKRIQEVMANLIINSINYGSKNGCTSVEFEDHEENILVKVCDNGIGIPNEDLPRIFERFYRVDEYRSRNKGGTGLGLAIVKHVIEAHNQTIRVRSKEGEGTCFSFTLRKGRSPE